MDCLGFENSFTGHGMSGDSKKVTFLGWLLTRDLEWKG